MLKKKREREIIEHFLIPYTKINSIWIKDLNVRPDTIKVLEENTRRTLFEINHSKTFFNPLPSVMKTKTNRWDLVKLKKLLHNKGNHKKMKRPPSEWEKICANEAPDKGLISKIYKQLM